MSDQRKLTANIRSNSTREIMKAPPKVLIIGGGFAGLSAAKRLTRKKLPGGRLRITLVDRANYHLFQPLLYQVATGGLSPANIAVPLRSLFRRQPNVKVMQDEITEIDLANRVARSKQEEYPFDAIIVAAGGITSYFGNDHWRQAAPGLKTLGDATKIRGRVLAALEKAELEYDPQEAQTSKLPTFVLAGGGPTGVEMAGAIAELTRSTLAGEFRQIDPARCRIVLVDPGPRLLSSYSQELSDKAAERMRAMGVEVRLGEKIVEVQPDHATLRSIGNDQAAEETIHSAVTIWAAGVAASPLAKQIAEQLPLEWHVETDRSGRLPIQPDLSLIGFPHVFAVGDMTRLTDEAGNLLPGVAPVAIQQGELAADNLFRCLQNKPTKPFRYRDYGSMAVIGRGAAIAEIHRWKLTGYPAWLAWLFVHLLQLVGYQNRMLVAFQWGWNYFTRNRSARLVVPAEVLLAEDSSSYSHDRQKA